MKNPESQVENKAENKAEKGGAPLWQSVLVGGVPGILIGGLGAAAFNSMAAATEVGVTPPDGGVGGGGAGAGSGSGSGSGSHVPDPSEIHEAQSVNDSMSFNEAFAAARAEVGMNGAFVWHGNVYSTFRADDPEWQAMTQEERLAHSEDILEQVHPTPYTPAHHAEEPPIVPVGGSGGGSEPDPVDDPGLDQPENSHFHVLGVESVETEDGDVVHVGYGELDGHMAVAADTDNDHLVDTLAVDENDDAQISDDEVYDVSDSGITVEDMHAAAAEGEAYYADNSGAGDYTNDADVSGFETV